MNPVGLPTGLLFLSFELMKRTRPSNGSLFRAARLSAVISYASLFVARNLSAEDHISVKWQDYSEDDGRIRVISRYLGFEKQVSSQVTVRGHGVIDTISGATPTGVPADSPDGAVPLSQLSDRREAGVIDIDWARETRKTTFQYAYSEESDFLSKGYSISHTEEFNKRNTGVSVGLSFIDDDVFAEPLLETEKKESYDYFIGVSQVLDPKTVVSLNFTYSNFNGYLSDPYKIVQRETEILPGLSLPLTFPENRPDERNRMIWFFNGKRFFDVLKGSLDFDYRYFDDDWGVESHTFDLEWYQKIGERWIIRPKYRYYRQNAADFYIIDLDTSPIEPSEAPNGSAPHYSTDYRLAKFASETYGVKIIFNATERLSFDVNFERYEMKGRDGITPQSTFPDADIQTIGGTLWF